jgi:hypothetical protein
MGEKPCWAGNEFSGGAVPPVQQWEHCENAVTDNKVIGRRPVHLLDDAADVRARDFGQRAEEARVGGPSGLRQAWRQA